MIFKPSLTIEFEADCIADARLKLKEFMIALMHGYPDIKSIKMNKDERLFEGDLQ